jgi:AcrR family transcriptional regulator
MDKGSGNETKERILKVAEELFAAHGFDSTSMREITKNAKVSLALVNYHFGSKKNLLLCLVERHFESINNERRKIFSDLDEQYKGKTIPMEEVLRALIMPYSSKMNQTPQHIMGLVQINSHHIKHSPDFWEEMWRKHFSDIIHWVTERLDEALPQMDKMTIYYRVHFVLSCMLSSIANPRRLYLVSGENINAESDEDRYHEEMMQFCVDAFRCAK